MIFDSTMLAAITSELQPLVGTRMRETWQGRGTTYEAEKAEPRAIYLSFAAGTVLIDTHPQRSRLHLVDEAPPGGTPTSFCDVLRKALRGAKLTGLEQPNFDRILRFDFAARDPIGNPVHYTLIAELMDRRSNVILLDSNGLIIDALKRLPPFLNRARTILPHWRYAPPPAMRRDPRTVEDWHAELSDIVTTGAEPPTEFPSVVAVLRERFAGISPPVATYIERAVASDTEPAEACQRFFKHLERIATGETASRSAFLCHKQPYPFALDSVSCTPVGQSLSELLEERIIGAARGQSLETRRSAVLTHLTRREKINKAQREDVLKALSHAAEAEKWKQQGTLLLANLPLVEEAAARGESIVEIRDEWSSIDVGDEGASAPPLRIPIEPKWSAADSATRLFNRYKRAQKLGEGAPIRQAELEAEYNQLARWRKEAQEATTEGQLDAIGKAAGMAAEKRDKPVSRTRQQEESARPESKLRRREVDGWQLWMGRSALENQILLSKVASPSDIWMHIRGMPSAHVIVKNQKGKAPPPKVLEEAGRWVVEAGMTKKQRVGERVEVIYTPAKWVRAVKGSPGRVTLQRFETLLVKV
jgi:predicted ribosome quality control (RQC) complex YloA/Tae2 family protein